MQFLMWVGLLFISFIISVITVLLLEKTTTDNFDDLNPAVTYIGGIVFMAVIWICVSNVPQLTQ